MWLPAFFVFWPLFRSLAGAFTARICFRSCRGRCAGRCLDPYNLASSSLSTLLHRLFIFEPQLNAHPALHAPWLFAILHPTFQLALLAPAVLWIDTRVSSPARIALEWSALLLATMTLTPLPASYHFTVLILPVAVLCGQLMQERRWALLAVVIGLYLAVGYPGWNTAAVDGWQALLHVNVCTRFDPVDRGGALFDEDWQG